MKPNLQHLKDLLLKESGVLEGQLASIGRKNPDDSADWEAVATGLDDDNADEFDVAEDLENFENNKAELDVLEVQLNNVKSALRKMDEGKYGVCEVCGKEIEDDRLEANPSATTCKQDMNS